MHIEKEIENLIENSLRSLEIEFQDLKITHPDFLEHGDFTFNILPLAKKNGKNPREFSEQIRTLIEKNSSENIEKIEIAGAGFLNFFLSKSFYKKYLENFSKSQKREKKKVLLEHTSTNLFKPFHIGHMVNNSIGESLGRIIKYLGDELTQITFPSDVSPGIAKTIWALKNQEITITNLTLQKIADSYVLGSKEYIESSIVKQEIDEVNKEIYNFLQNPIKEKSENILFYEKGKELSLEHFGNITKRLGSDFSEKIFESESEKIGKEIVKKNIPEIFQKSQGAVIFEGKDFTNVFINSDGFGTYLAKDIGLLKIKSKIFFDVEKSLTITDSEQKQHFEMIREAGEKISEILEFTKKTKFLQHGRMNFIGNTKISSRYGNVPLATDVIDKVQKNILEKMGDRDFSEEEKKEISQKLAIANLKYSILKVTSGKNISFDMEKDLNPQGNTATFLIYTFVRAKSVLNNVDFGFENFEERKKEISNLEKILYRFEGRVVSSMEDYSPHHLANYLYNLSSEFNTFYANTKILDEKNPDYKYNLKVVEKFSEIMKKGLELLGFETVEKM